MIKRKGTNQVFIATSMDGYIADQHGQIDWLHEIPNPDGDDMGYQDFISQVDAIVMGRVTFETVLSFGIDWPYQIPVFVLSGTWEVLPPSNATQVQLISGTPHDLINEIHGHGYHNLYIDGGGTIRRFLSSDLIDRMIITTIPILLGGGTPLFGSLPARQKYKCIRTRRYLDQIVQCEFVRSEV